MALEKRNLYIQRRGLYLTSNHQFKIVFAFVFPIFFRYQINFCHFRKKGTSSSNSKWIAWLSPIYSPYGLCWYWHHQKLLTLSYLRLVHFGVNSCKNMMPEFNIVSLVITVSYSNRIWATTVAGLAESRALIVPVVPAFVPVQSYRNAIFRYG